MNEAAKLRLLTLIHVESNREMVRLIEAHGLNVDPIIALLVNRLLIAQDELDEKEFAEPDSDLDHDNSTPVEVEELERRIEELENENERLRESKAPPKGKRPGPEPRYLKFLISQIQQHGPQQDEELVRKALEKWPGCKKQIRKAMRDANGRELEISNAMLVILKSGWNKLE